MSDLIIRGMEPGDILQVHAIEKACFSEPWSQQGFLDSLAMDNTMFLVAVREEKIVGYCGMYLALDEGEITNVAVDKDFRRCHIAHRLLEELLGRSRQARIKTVILEVRISNEGAIKLYQSLGFSKEGKRKNFYKNPVEDAYIMVYNQ